MKRAHSLIGECSMQYLSGNIDYRNLKDLVFENYEQCLDHMSSSSSSDSDSDKIDPDHFDDIPIEVLNKIITKSKMNNSKTAKRKRICSRSKEIREQLRVNRRQRHFLSSDCASLIGMANIAYARGEFEDGLRLSKLAVTKAPKAAEAWLILAQILDERDQHDLSFEIRMLVAYLTNTKDDWITLYQRALANNKINIAATCIARAVACDPLDIDLHLARLQLTSSYGLDGKRIDALYKLLSALNVSVSDNNFKLHILTVKEIVQRLERSGDMKQAEQILRKTYELYDNKVQDREIRKLISIQLYLSFFRDVILVLLNRQLITIDKLDRECSMIQRSDESCRLSYRHISNLGQFKVNLKENLEYFYIKAILIACIRLDCYNAVDHLVHAFIRYPTIPKYQPIRIVLQLIESLLQEPNDRSLCCYKLLRLIGTKNLPTYPLVYCDESGVSLPRHEAVCFWNLVARTLSVMSGKHNDVNCEERRNLRILAIQAYRNLLNIDPDRSDDQLALNVLLNEQNEPLQNVQSDNVNDNLTWRLLQMYPIDFEMFTADRIVSDDHICHSDDAIISNETNINTSGIKHKNLITHGRCNTATHKVSQNSLRLLIDECLELLISLDNAQSSDMAFRASIEDDFVVAAMKLLFGDLQRIIRPKSIIGIFRSNRYDRGMMFRDILKSSNNLVESAHCQLDELSKENVFHIYTQLCNLFIRRDSYRQFQTVAILANILPILYKQPKWTRQFDFVVYIASLLAGDGYTASAVFKYFYDRGTLSINCLNCLSLASTVCPTVAFQKYVKRLCDLNNCNIDSILLHQRKDEAVDKYLTVSSSNEKSIENLGLLRLHANLAMVNGSYKRALRIYNVLARFNENDPFIYLMIAIAKLCQFSQRNVNNRNWLLTECLNMFQVYCDKRGECQEIYYNMGRAFQQISFFTAAEKCYRKVLAMESAAFSSEISSSLSNYSNIVNNNYNRDQNDTRFHNIFDLKRQAAFNLVMMYNNRNIKCLSREIVNKFLVV